MDQMNRNLYELLFSCKGNWRNAIYVPCGPCPHPCKVDRSGCLAATRQDVAPLLVSILDFEKETGFPRTDLVYDKQEDAIFECVVYNNDFVDQTPVDMWYEHGILKIINNDGIAFIKKLEANELVEDYEKGKLKGRLNEIAAGLNEESNPVIMVAKYKE